MEPANRPSVIRHGEIQNGLHDFSAVLVVSLELARERALDVVMFALFVSVWAVLFIVLLR